MDKNLCVTLAQLDFKVGAIDENVQMHIEAAHEAKTQHHSELIIFPELSITGYPPEDLLLRPDFIEQAYHGLEKILADIRDIYCIVGLPVKVGDNLYNSCYVLYNGEIIGRYAKHYLPNYAIFEEARYFTPGKKACTFNIKNIKFGLIICEDAWFTPPMQNTVSEGAEIILIPNASPFATNKFERRLGMLNERSAENHLPMIYVNTIGGQDELIFDGSSMAVNSSGQLCYFSGMFNKGIFPMQIKNAEPVATKTASIPSEIERIYQALVIATRDYLQKNNFKGALIGVSGGIDSALTTTIAVDAIGKEHIEAVLMPSGFTAEISMQDGLKLVENLGIKHRIIPIDESYTAFVNSLQLTDQETGVTKQNLQARCRAVILMALSNETNQLVLTTGNRSELATGYCTLYGDMAGGFAVLKDIPKMMVYALAKYRNSISPVIPERTITRPPTAELAPNQLDQDALPPYPILDEILYLYLNEERSKQDIIAKGFDAATVEKIITLIHRNEYKRRQAAIGPRINLKAFGKDRRYPITSGYKG